MSQLFLYKIIGLINLDPLIVEPEDAKNLILNDFTGYQAVNDLDTFCLSSVKVEYLGDDSNLLTSFKKEGNFENTL